MAQKRIYLTDQSVRDLPAPEGENAPIIYDTKLQGFGVRVTPAGAKSFVFVYRSPTKPETYTIGRFKPGHHNPWPAAKARRLVKQFVKKGADPAAFT